MLSGVLKNKIMSLVEPIIPFLSIYVWWAGKGEYFFGMLLFFCRLF